MFYVVEHERSSREHAERPTVAAAGLFLFVQGSAELHSSTALRPARSSGFSLGRRDPYPDVIIYIREVHHGNMGKAIIVSRSIPKSCGFFAEIQRTLRGISRGV